MKYIVYLTINTKSKINGHLRIYVGVHQTENPDIFDGYIGGGCWVNKASSFKYPKTPIQCAVKKYGADSFVRITLFEFDTVEEAYKKEAEIITEDFVKQSHVYNVIGDVVENKPLYQFDLQGKLVKTWNNPKKASEFYGYSIFKFQASESNKRAFLNSYWSNNKQIDITEYNNKSFNNFIYLFNKDGKLVKELESKEKCCEFINCDKTELNNAIRTQLMITKDYYVSDSMTDQFIPKARNNYITRRFFVYDVDGNLISKCVGKELMKVISLHSWMKISNIFSKNNGWYKDFYISLEEIDTVPVKNASRRYYVDVYDKYGNFIEKITSFSELKEKYNVPNSKIKDIQQGDRYFDKYIFKYSK